MSELYKVLALLAVLFLLIGAMWLVALKLGLLKPAAKGKFSKAAHEINPFRVRDAVLSPGERAFMDVLQEAVGAAFSGHLRANTPAPGKPASGLPVVYPSVRLAEVIEIDSAKAQGASIRTSAFNRISSKQIDFIVCDAVTTRPLLAVELDDQTHQQPKRRARDADVDRVCAAAGLAVLHVRAAAAYDARDLATRIIEVVARKPMPSR